MCHGFKPYDGYSDCSISYDSLTPNYDQLFATSFKQKSDIGYMALDLLKEEEEGIFTEAYKIYGYYTSADFYQLGFRTGLNHKVVRTLIKSYVDRENDMILMINRSFMPDDMKRRAVETVTGRLEALQTRFGCPHNCKTLSINSYRYK